MTRYIPGVIHGRTVQLFEDPGAPEGTEVQVIVQTSQYNPTPTLEGLRRCAGSLANDWTEEDDQILAELYRERHADSRPEPAE